MERAKQAKILSLIKSYLKTNKDLSQLLTGDGSFINCYNKDTHRLHGKVSTLGALSGRCTHSSPNITQLSKDKELRELLTVPEGKLLLDVDAGSLELVMLGHYLGPYDNYKYAKIVDSGDKDKGTDIHTVNQKIAGLPTRDSAKTFIYATIYGAGSTKIGQMICHDTSIVKCSKEEFLDEKERLMKQALLVEGNLYFPFDKSTLIPFDDDLVLKSIYGRQAQNKFKDGTTGYNELVAHLTELANSDNLRGLDGRLFLSVEPHKALNLLLQSAGAIYMKNMQVHLDEVLSKKWTHGKEYAYVANIHDAVNIEIISEISDEICEDIRKAFIDASYMLGLKYPVYGDPKVGLNQWETH